MAEDPLQDCPACKKPALVRQVSAVGFALKGSGWYVTDFRDKGKPAAKATDTPTDTTAPAAESKPAAIKPAETKPADSGTKAATGGD